jgi:Fic-DOC domain mobile mystery protein B
MSKTGGGPGTNQHNTEGVGKGVKSLADVKTPNSESTPGLLDREWDLHHTQFGETPIDEDAREFLTLAFRDIETKDDLNFAESNNIATAAEWLEANPFSAHGELLDQTVLRMLHRRMFGEVWTWAGKIRERETNMGVDPHQIVIQWEDALRDAKWQIANSSYEPAEICVRLHRRMLAIHCFPNGNGRHARMVANELGRLLGLGDNPFTWGGEAGRGREEELRREYLDALQLADSKGDFAPLVAIALS